MRGVATARAQNQNLAHYGAGIAAQPLAKLDHMTTRRASARIGFFDGAAGPACRRSSDLPAKGPHDEIVNPASMLALALQHPPARREPHSTTDHQAMYNRDQWIESFEGQLSILRPHLTPRVLSTMSLAAWAKHGRRDEDPIAAAKAWSRSLGEKNSGA